MQAIGRRASVVLEPLLPLLAATMYARFCAAIEPDERIYHSSDRVVVADQLG